MTRTGRVPRLMAHAKEPLLDINPQDAARLGLDEGCLARVESRYGSVTLRVRLSSDQRCGEVFAPMHWTDQFSSAGPIDRLVGSATDPVSGQPELKATAVRVVPRAARWRGVLLRRADFAPVGDFHWARVPLAGGHAFDLAGWEALPSGDALEPWVLALLGASAMSELIVYADTGRGAYRFAYVHNGRLEACLFLARDGVLLPARDSVAERLGAAIEPGVRITLVGGMAAGAARPDPGPIVCACFAIGLSTLQRAVVDRQLTSLADIARVLRAGANCGSCLPELRAILVGTRTGGAQSNEPSP
jgi:assimilatory nitrate reductase catalytic subunit